MERFLYSARNRLRDMRTQAPLLIFRNDGAAASVAKTVAVRTYSSGPRGGMEGARALAAQYGWRDAVSFDVGGTTTDIGRVLDGVVNASRRGLVEGIPVCFPLCDVVSHGVGGGSIIRAEDGRIRVGPQSVGGAPGPACFGFGGTEATITDAYLLMGLLDPATYFGGELPLDAARATAAVQDKVAKPLNLPLDAALLRMERAWIHKVADAIRAFGSVDAETTLVAFGGGGGFAATDIADVLGVQRVVIPGLAAVFSAYGIGFSDVAHSYDFTLASLDQAGLDEQRARALVRARQDMLGEGAALEDCRVDVTLEVIREGDIQQHALTVDGALPVALRPGDVARLKLTATRPMPRPAPATDQAQSHDATSSGTRRVQFEAGVREVPVIRLADQAPGARAVGPLVLEEDYLTGKVGEGWQVSLTAARDIVLDRI
jgi:N-methylhydantoinase A/oxoprolinase/acetone carboxylase beta subunit